MASLHPHSSSESLASSGRVSDDLKTVLETVLECRMVRVSKLGFGTGL